MRLLREHGARPKYYHALVGTNSRLDALQAAILRVKLRHLDRWSESARKNAALYDQLFEGSRVGRPYRDPRARHIYNQYVIRVAEARRAAAAPGASAASAPRSTTRCRSTCSSASPRSAIAPGDMPQSEAAAHETLALPIYPELGEDQHPLRRAARCGSSPDRAKRFHRRPGAPPASPP